MQVVVLPHDELLAALAADVGFLAAVSPKVDVEVGLRPEALLAALDVARKVGGMRELEENLGLENIES